jgi:hypothetical protein
VSLISTQLSRRERLSSGRKPPAEPNFPLPRLDPSVRGETESKVRPYGFIDYLYRLRIKTSYVDSAMFTDGLRDQDSARKRSSRSPECCDETMHVTELHASPLVGTTVLKDWADKWLASNSVPGKNVGLALRRGLL